MTVVIRQGDCREILRTLPAQSVHCCVTSPPYFGLRDYGTAQWAGGDLECDHKQGRPGAGRADGIVDDRAQRNRDGVGSMGGDCRHCGALRIDSQIGLESTPDAFVAEMVAVFREVRRALRDDGTLWLNLGDSYARSDKKGGSGFGGKNQKYLGDNYERAVGDVPPGLKQKDLIGVPWRVAFALQADGWYLRQDIIWSKPNPMPESVTDRCTKAHEYIFLMSKRARYYYNAAAIKEAAKWADDNRAGEGRLTYDGKRQGVVGTGNEAFVKISDTRNKRSVWEVTTQGYADAHFATFPPALVEPCIKAGCPAGGTVLDPFGGAGTTGMVADRQGRHAILIELNPDYAAMAQRRIEDDAGMFAQVSA